MNENEIDVLIETIGKELTTAGEMFGILQNRVIKMERRILILEGKKDNRVLIDEKHRSNRDE